MLRPRSNSSVFLLVSVFIAFNLILHISPFLYKNGGREKPPFLCFHTDQVRFQNLPFSEYPLLIAFSKTSVAVALFSGFLCLRFFSPFLHKNGAV